MRRTRFSPHRTPTGAGPTSLPETNCEVWVQLVEEPCSTNATIFETIQELKDEMGRLWEDNERLMQKHENIMKSLSDRKNHKQTIPTPKHGNMTGE